MRSARIRYYHTSAIFFAYFFDPFFILDASDDPRTELIDGFHCTYAGLDIRWSCILSHLASGALADKMSSDGYTIFPPPRCLLITSRAHTARLGSGLCPSGNDSTGFFSRTLSSVKLFSYHRPSLHCLAFYLQILCAETRVIHCALTFVL